jgi:hypothetical protein
MIFSITDFNNRIFDMVLSAENMLLAIGSKCQIVKFNLDK